MCTTIHQGQFTFKQCMYKIYTQTYVHMCGNDENYNCNKWSNRDTIHTCNVCKLLNQCKWSRSLFQFSLLSRSFTEGNKARRRYISRRRYICDARASFTYPAALNKIRHGLFSQKIPSENDSDRILARKSHLCPIQSNNNFYLIQPT
jgi:hypothetical protein